MSFIAIPKNILSFAIFLNSPSGILRYFFTKFCKRSIYLCFYFILVSRKISFLFSLFFYALFSFCFCLSSTFLRCLFFFFCICRCLIPRFKMRCINCYGVIHNETFFNRL